MQPSCCIVELLTYIRPSIMRELVQFYKVFKGLFSTPGSPTMLPANPDKSQVSSALSTMAFTCGWAGTSGEGGAEYEPDVRPCWPSANFQALAPAAACSVAPRCPGTSPTHRTLSQPMLSSRRRRAEKTSASRTVLPGEWMSCERRWVGGWEGGKQEVGLNGAAGASAGGGPTSFVYAGDTVIYDAEGQLRSTAAPFMSPPHLLLHIAAHA